MSKYFCTKCVTYYADKGDELGRRGSTWPTAEYDSDREAARCPFCHSSYDSKEIDPDEEIYASQR